MESLWKSSLGYTANEETFIFFLKERKQLKLGENIESLWRRNLNPILPQPLSSVHRSFIQKGGARKIGLLPPSALTQRLQNLSGKGQPTGFLSSAVKFLVSIATRRKRGSSIVFKAQLLYVKFIPNC